MKGMTKGTRSIPKTGSGKQAVRPSPPSGSSKGAGQWGGNKPTGGRV